jgi:hypothetical protein
LAEALMTYDLKSQFVTIDFAGKIEFR